MSPHRSGSLRSLLHSWRCWISCSPLSRIFSGVDLRIRRLLVAFRHEQESFCFILFEYLCSSSKLFVMRLRRFPIRTCLHYLRVARSKRMRECMIQVTCNANKHSSAYHMHIIYHTPICYSPKVRNSEYLVRTSACCCCVLRCSIVPGKWRSSS